MTDNGVPDVVTRLMAKVKEFSESLDDEDEKALLAAIFKAADARVTVNAAPTRAYESDFDTSFSLAPADPSAQLCEYTTYSITRAGAVLTTKHLKPCHHHDHG
ncbi:hypothetical protein GCM10029964_071940 [Kibdelosporangium lantanae]